MISSMTGFARQEAAGPFGVLVCEIRSVNHRFLDAGLRLPDSCRTLEPELRQALARDFKRGKIDCTLHHRPPEAAAQSLDIDQPRLDALLERVKALAKVVPAAQINVLDLLRWPGVLHDAGDDAKALLAPVRALFTATCTELVQARSREGQRLASLIEHRCETLAAMVAGVQARLPEVQVKIRQRFAERLAELGAAVDKDRMEQEILLMLQRFDVAEELDRLNGHVEEARRTLASPEPAGRRLDFLMQEFNREANTLSSKSQDLETTRAAVEMKVLIEQMREQVQNIE